MKRSKPHALFILMISVHGLIRDAEPELGSDADTGGQIKYVLELVRGLSELDDIGQIELITRRIRDARIATDYNRKIEPVSHSHHKVRIVRIQAGPDGYMPKEQLWDYLDTLSDNLLDWLYEQPHMPDLIHGHYADGGYVGTRIAKQLGVPLVFTGHSLGRDKRKQLLAKGMTNEDIDQNYNIVRRINAEETVLANANLVIASTHHEVEEQYALYNYYDPSRMVVIPPGTDLKLFYPPGAQEKIAFANKVAPFLSEPDKPMILAICRPDERKNLLTLIEAYGESKALQNKANLLLVLGNRHDIRQIDSDTKSVLLNVLMLIDTYDLYGKVAYPKQHRPKEVPQIYRLVAQSGGVLVNPALTEPFGLTLLEAAASGLPVVATENGGPVDIIRNCKNGLLVDPLDRESITQALLKMLRSSATWQSAAKSGIEGVKQHYSWYRHADHYLKQVRDIIHKSPLLETLAPLVISRTYRDRAIFSSLDENLIGDEAALEQYVKWIKAQRKSVVFGIATARRLDSALALLRKHNVPHPDVLISSMGTRIHYTTELVEDDNWMEHISYQWNETLVRRILSNTPGLVLQPLTEQTTYKISYFYDPEVAPDKQSIIDLLHSREATVNVILYMEKFLDIMPTRASKGQALRYITKRLGIPLENTLVSGGTGGNIDMMSGNTRAVVVANRNSNELQQLSGQERIYFSPKSYAAGILDAIDYYQFLDV